MDPLIKIDTIWIFILKKNLFNLLTTHTFTAKFNGKHPYSVNKVYDRIAKMDVYVDVYFWIGCGPMKKITL